jgi:exosortase
MTLTRRTILFCAYCLSLVLIHAQLLRALYDYSVNNVAASHVVLMPFVTAALIFHERKSIFSTVRTSWGVGLLIVLAGAVMGVATWFHFPAPIGIDSLMWGTGALALMAVGGFVLCYGRDASRAAVFPLGMLLFMVPIPPVILDAATVLLKRGSTELVAGLFSLSGTPYHREGYVFTLPNLMIEVADECSGIRSSIALLLTTLLGGHMFLRSARNRVLLVLAIVPLAILKNGIRIASLSLLAIHVDKGFIVGRLHHEGGIVFFLIALFLLSPFLAFLRSSELRQRSSVRAA